MNEMKDYILGVDLGGTNIKAAAYRLESYEKVGEKRLPTQVEGGWEHVLGRVLAALEELLRQTPRERVLCVGMGVPGLLAVFLAVPIGFAGMVGIALAVRQAVRLQYDGTLDPRNAVGLTGTVYLTVPAGRAAPGKVELTVQEQLREFEAVTDSPEPIPTGDPVRVTGLAGRSTLLVEPAPALSKQQETPEEE